MSNIEQLIRKNIQGLKPYSSARDEYSGQKGVFLDANENPFNSPYNRYPDPLQRELKNRISGIKKVPVENIFLGNGSDEAIDLLIRIFCEPRLDNILSIDPSYGMYGVCAAINDVEFRKVSLTSDYQPYIEAVMKRADRNSKILFLCSPNNPTANSLDPVIVRDIIQQFKGIVVIDEAYIDFSTSESFLVDIVHYPNLVVLQTFSKAWGLAGIRLGMAFAGMLIIQYMNKVKYPYNVNSITQQKAIESLDKEMDKNEWVEGILKERGKVADQLKKISFIHKVYPSDANFLLVKMDDPIKIYKYLVEKKIIVRDRSSVHLCEGALRITIGTPWENKALLDALQQVEN